MTVEWFDLAQRLAAATSGRVVDRLAHSPIRTPLRPVAVRAAMAGPRVSVTAAVPGARAQTREDVDALRMLGDLGVLVSGDPCTLVTDHPRTLVALRRLAYRAREDGRVGDVAAHVGWWADRADFPGSSSTVNLVSACTTRWVTGTTPEAERQAATWRRWLRISDDSVSGMFALLDLVAEGDPLPLLAEIAADDAYTWDEATQAYADRWDWRTPDTTGRAAYGLRARCDTADLWAAALLDDPTYRRRAVHTGHVVHGTSTVPSGKSKTALRVTCDRMDARLRAGSGIVGWTPAIREGGPRFSGYVTGTGVSGGRLVLDLSVGSALRPAAGSRVTLIPAPPDTGQARRGRRQYRSLYATRTSWLSTGRTPVPMRRDVPLDVLLAGASDD